MTKNFETASFETNIQRRYNVRKINVAGLKHFDGTDLKRPNAGNLFAFRGLIERTPHAPSRECEAMNSPCKFSRCCFIGRQCLLRLPSATACPTRALAHLLLFQGFGIMQFEDYGLPLSTQDRLQDSSLTLPQDGNPPSLRFRRAKLIFRLDRTRPFYCSGRWLSG